MRELRAGTSWFGQAATVNGIIECTRAHIEQFGDDRFQERVVDIYRPLDVEGQVFIELSNADKDCFNYFYEMCRQAMVSFANTPRGRSVDPQSHVEVIVNTWKGLLGFLREDPRFDPGRVHG